MNAEPVVNLHIYLSDITYQSRIGKETRSIAKLGLADQVIIVSQWKRGMLFTEQLDSIRKVVRIRLRTAVLPDIWFFNFVKYLELAFRLIWKFYNTKITFINCHNVFLLPIGLYFKYIHKSVLIYDAHELETERMGLGSFMQKISRRFERKAMRHVDELIVVSDSIEKWYRNEYNFPRIHLIRNIPSVPGAFPEPSNYFREKFNLRSEDILFIYQGLISAGRGIKIMLEAFSRIGQNKYLIVMGYGDETHLVNKYRDQHSNILFHEVVRPEHILKYTSSADVGISLIENTCLSYYYSLPNKVFEYLSCGMPVIVSDFPDMGNLIDQCNCGWKIQPRKEDFQKLLKSITPEMILEKRENALKSREFFKWENEEKKLLDIYRLKPVDINV